MPECQNCGGHITDDYVRVFSQNGAEDVFCCPNCPDRIRAGNHFREARSSRDSGTEPTEYQENYDV